MEHIEETDALFFRRVILSFFWEDVIEALEDVVEHTEEEADLFFVMFLEDRGTLDTFVGDGGGRPVKSFGFVGMFVIGILL